MFRSASTRPESDPLLRCVPRWETPSRTASPRPDSVPQLPHALQWKLKLITGRFQNFWTFLKKFVFFSFGSLEKCYRTPLHFWIFSNFMILYLDYQGNLELSKVTFWTVSGFSELFYFSAFFQRWVTFLLNISKFRTFEFCYPTP